MPSSIAPDSLPARIYLLACDVERHKLAGGELPVLVRGAALADLDLRGCLAEEGRTVQASGTKRTGDSVLDGILRDISEDRPRSWRSWTGRSTKRTLAAVQRQLAAAGVISVEQERKFGVFPTLRVTVTDPAQVTALRDSVQEAVRGTHPMSTKDALLVALVSVGELNFVLSRKDRKEFGERIKELTEQSSAVVPALSKVIRKIKATRAAATAGG